VGYSVAANGGTGERQGTVTVAGQTFTVTQAGNPVLFSDDFSGGFAGWTVVDEGNYSTPSNWSVVGGELRQTSNINASRARMP
jgi:hypothetical protein